MNSLIGKRVVLITDNDGDEGVVHSPNEWVPGCYWVDWKTGVLSGKRLTASLSQLKVIEDSEKVINEITIDGVRYTLTRVENQ